LPCDLNDAIVPNHNSFTTVDGQDDDDDDDDNNNNSNTAMVVADLRAQLAAARHELQEERQARDAAIQALQMRLYIAETRLKTYQDALLEHNRVVADNIVGSSPDRSSRQQQQQQRDEPELPHYSRVLKNQIV